MFLLNLYLNEVEGLAPGPRRRGGAVVAPRRRGQGADPNNGEMPNQTKTSLTTSQTPAYKRRVATIRS
jgi:hypothetical protein